MSFLDHIAACNNADLSQFEPWYVASARAGFLHRDFLPTVAVRPDLFSHRDGGWYLEPSLDTPVKRTAAMRTFLLELRDRGLFGKTWREEPYKVAPHFNAPTLLEMERAAVPWFGVRAYGPHMTGYVKKRGGLHIWVPRRSYTKPTYPGELDNTVAGGQPANIGIFDNLIKECAEEASIPRSVAEQAKAVGIVAYWNQSGRQLKPDVMTCFDLELPADFIPRAHDGEVHAFELWPIEQVYETVRDTNQFKYNCNLVLIDFFVRHGLLRADDTDYFAIVEGLRRMQPTGS